MTNQIPIVASADDLSSAIDFASKRSTARWYVKSRVEALAASLERPELLDLIPAEWNLPVTAAVAQYSDEERAEFAKNGIAMADGSYPIPDKAHVSAAVDDYNRTNAGDDVKKHIIQRAVKLDATSELPSDWVDPDGDGDNDLIASKDTDHDDAAYRTKLGLAAAAEQLGLTTEQAEKLAESYFSLPENIVASVEEDLSEVNSALIDATDFDALVASNYYTDYGVEDAYDEYDSDDDLPDSIVASATIQLTADKRKEYAKKGIALPDGSYPIPNRRYLKKAIRAVGRGSNNSKSKIMSHIKKRAAALGATSTLTPAYGIKAAAESALEIAVDDTALTKEALHARVATIRAAATEMNDALAKEALRERVNRGKGDGVADASTVTAALDLKKVEKAAHDFDEALHPRGRDGEFITKGGRVVVHSDSGHDVEGTVEHVDRTGIQVKTDAGSVEHVQSHNISKAPTAVARLNPTTSAPHSNPQTASEHLDNAQHHIAQSNNHLDKAVKTSGAAHEAHAQAAAQHSAAAKTHRDAAVTMMKADTHDEDHSVDPNYEPGTEAYRGDGEFDIGSKADTNAKLADDVGGPVSPTLRSDTEKAAEAGEGRESLNSIATRAMGSDLTKAKVDSLRTHASFGHQPSKDELKRRSDAKQALRDRVSPVASQRYVARERSGDSKYDVIDKQGANEVIATHAGRNRALSHARALNTPEAERTDAQKTAIRVAGGEKNDDDLSTFVRDGKTGNFVPKGTETPSTGPIGYKIPAKPNSANAVGQRSTQTAADAHYDNRFSTEANHSAAVVEQLKRMGYTQRDAKGGRNLTSKDKATRISVNPDGTFGMKVQRTPGASYSARKHGVDTSSSRDAHTIASDLHEAGRTAPAVKPHVGKPAGETAIDRARSQALQRAQQVAQDRHISISNAEVAKSEARVRIAQATHQGEVGHTITGKDTRGRKVSVFTPGDRSEAEKAAANIKAGNSAFAPQRTQSNIESARQAVKDREAATHTLKDELERVHSGKA